MTFEDWLYRARVTDDPVGDFVEDARVHTRVAMNNHEPRPFARVTSLLGLRRALPVTACDECRAILPQVWRRYRRWASRQVDLPVNKNKLYV